MNIQKNILLLAVVLVGLFPACNDWTETESLSIDRPLVEESSTSQYLENLRAYKQSEHKLLIGWFDNSDKTYNSRGNHLGSLPDKVDIVVLTQGNELTDVENSEIASIRKDKGTRVLFNIDYEGFRQYIEDENKEREAAAAKDAAADEAAPYDTLHLVAELPLFLESLPALSDDYDGFSLCFVGVSGGTSDEQSQQQKIQFVLFNKIESLMNANPNKTYIFEGNPVNVIDKTILNKFTLIALNTSTVTSINRLTEAVRAALMPGVPINRFVVCAIPYSLDSSDDETGYIIGEDGSRQGNIKEMAYWTGVPDAFTKKGLGILHINADYYNADLDYKYTREAIDIMNPSLKNN